MAYLRTKNYSGQTLTGELTIDGSLDPSWNDADVIGGTLNGTVYITNVRNMRLQGWDINGGSQIGIYVEQSGTQDIVLYNNFVHDCQKDGIFVNEGTASNAPRHVNLQILNNRVYSCGLGGSPGDTDLDRQGIQCFAKDYVIQGNDVQNVPFGYGILCHSTGKIAANKVRQPKKNGIAVISDRTAGATALRLTGNDVAHVNTWAGIALYNGGFSLGTVEIDRNLVATAPAGALYSDPGITTNVHDNTLNGVGTIPPDTDPPNPPQPPATGLLGEPRYFPGTIVMMNADGPPGTSELLDGDTGLRGKTIELVGGCSLRAYGKPNQRAIRLDGSLTQFVRVVHGELAFANFDAAIELIVRADALDAAAILFDTRADDGTNGFALGASPTLLTLFEGAVSKGSAGVPALGKELYLAWVRIAGTSRFYAGLVADGTVPVKFTAATTSQPSNGRLILCKGVRGYLVAARVSRRTGRGFTPASIPALGSFPLLV